jgi:hypothetical protein
MNLCHFLSRVNQVKLISTQGTEEKDPSKSVTIAGSSAILSYNDIELGIFAGDDVYGTFFSFSQEKILIDREVKEENGSEIGLAFGNISNAIYYFESHAESSFNIPNAKQTQVIKYEETPTFSVEEFTSLENDSELAQLSIVGTNDSFGTNSIRTKTILFQIAEGRKGVILTKAANSDRLLVDIKIQKY